jgi:hypothetical protein
LRNITGILGRLEGPVDDAAMVTNMAVKGPPKRWIKLTAPTYACELPPLA